MPGDAAHIDSVVSKCLGELDGSESKTGHDEEQGGADGFTVDQHAELSHVHTYVILIFKCYSIYHTFFIYGEIKVAT